MTIKQVLTLRNFMIILCIFMFILLGQKVWRIENKINTVQEAERLYAAGDLIGAEKQYRQASANSSILYKESQITSRLNELAPITAIRNGLSTLVLTVKAQLATRDFAGFMESYASLLALKSDYMSSGGLYESYYRQLSAESGLSPLLTSGFKQFKEQFFAELAESQSSTAGDVSSGDSFKWNLLRIPEVYYGEGSAKEELLTARFQAHDEARLKKLAASGSFGPLLDAALSMSYAYNSHSYAAPWVEQQVEESTKILLNKDLESERIAAFAGHAAAYRAYASSAGISSSTMLSLIDSNTSRLLRNASRLVRKGQYAEAIQLYGDLAAIQDTSPETSAARLAWNTAEPVRLLPGGEEPGKYTKVVSVLSRFGAKVAVAGTDSSGRLYYADMSEDGVVSTRSGEMIPDYENLRSLAFDDILTARAEVPVVVAEGGREDGRTSYHAYTIRPEGISLLFSFAGDSYELRSDDGSIRVNNADVGDGVDGQTAIYRENEGVYQFSEMYQEYPLIGAYDLELHPFENVSLGCEIYIDSQGRSVAQSDGRYFALQGNADSITGRALVSGQFQNGYEYVETELGEQYVPVFVVTSVGSMSLQLP